MHRASWAAFVVLNVLSACPSASAADATSKAIDALLSDYHNVGAFNGTALVARSGRVILKRGFGSADFEWNVPNTADTKFRLGSITKQFTAMLVMQLVEDGKLSLETTLADALPHYRQDTGRRITIHHLLNHTSGIPNCERPPDALEQKHNRWRDPEFVRQRCNGDLEFEPGTKYRYSNVGYSLLGAIIEEVTGQTYEQVLKERVLDPVGMSATGYAWSEPILKKRARGYEAALRGVRNGDYTNSFGPYAAGGMYSTVEDLYLWDQALYGDRLLPSAAKEKMFTPGLEHYGYGWVARREPIGLRKSERVTISHEGRINGFSCLIMRMTEDRHLIVLLDNTSSANLRSVSLGIADILYGRTPGPARRPLSRVLFETISTGGIAAGVDRYRELRQGRVDNVDMGEDQLNRVGSELLRVKPRWTPEIRPLVDTPKPATWEWRPRQG